MHPLVRLFIGALLACASVEVFAQTGQSDPQPPKPQCAGLHLPVNATLIITLKDRRKLKGKLSVARADDFEIVSKGKTQTIACANVAQAVPPLDFGHRLKHVIAVPLAITGVAISLPGLLVVAAGARGAGMIIASPGLLFLAAECKLDEDHCVYPLQILP